MKRRNGTTASRSGFYKNMIFTERNSGTHCDWPERNPNPNPMPNITLTLSMSIPNPTLTLTSTKITVIYAVQLPNVFRKLIVTFRRVPWIILFQYLTE